MRSFFAFVVLLSIACAAFAAPPRITGWLHTSGTQILDQNDQPVRLCGMGSGTNLAIPSGETATGIDRWKPPTKAQYDNISNWGFNAVRVFISWGSLEPTAPTRNADGTLTHHWNKGFLDVLDGIVREYGKRHIGVVFTMSHGKWFVGTPDSEFPAWLYKSTAGRNEFRQNFFRNVGSAPIKPLDGFIEAWKLVASRYADNPALVGIDILNEPGYNGGDDLDAFYAAVAKGIRSANSHVLIIFEDALPFRHQLILQELPPVDNVVYSVHLYTKNWTNEGKSWMEMVGKQAAEWKVPVYVGEFNAFDGGLNIPNPKTRPADWQGQTKQFLDYCREHGISWSFFTYEGHGPSWSSIVTPGTDKPKEGLVKLLQSGF